MAKKILFATGCSYTDKDFISFDNSLEKEKMGGWKMWPEIMAEELGLTCINTGKCGAGSDYMFNETIKAIAMYGDRVDTVAILWSGSDRSSFYGYNFNPLVEILEDDNHKTADGKKWDPFLWMDEIGIGKINRKFWKSNHFNKYAYINMIENQLIKMLSIIEICKAKNIKLVMGQGVTFFNYYAIELMLIKKIISNNAYVSKKEIIDMFLKNCIFSKIDMHKDNIIGWPFFSSLGGKDFDLIRDASREKYFISKSDRHPNELAQKLFADMFLKKYKDLYG